MGHGDAFLTFFSSLGGDYILMYSFSHRTFHIHEVSHGMFFEQLYAVPHQANAYLIETKARFGAVGLRKLEG